MFARCGPEATARRYSSLAFISGVGPGVAVNPKENVPRHGFVESRRAQRTSITIRRGGSNASEDDLGERIFGFFFGRKEANPLGLKRFNRDTFPEQYPATLDEFAEPVDGDTDEIALFRPLLARTQLCARRLRLAFDTDTDGWSAATFHQKVDRQGAGVVLAFTEDGTICGGYNPKVTAHEFRSFLMSTINEALCDRDGWDMVSLEAPSPRFCSPGWMVI